MCSYNHFQSDELRIDSWEHKCPDCGHRETQAFRSDDEDLADDIVAALSGVRFERFQLKSDEERCYQ